MPESADRLSSENWRPTSAAPAAAEALGLGVSELLA
jgi:hypothetical protein